MNSAQGRPLRVGVLCSGATVPAWAADALRAVLAVDCVTVAVVGDLALPVARPASAMWRRYLRDVVEPQSRAMRPVAISEVVGDAETVSLGDDAAAADRLRAFDLDVILSVDPAAPRTFASEAREGLWVYRHGDPGGFAGFPGLIELSHKRGATEVALLRFRTDSDAGEQIHFGRFKTGMLDYVASLDHIAFGAAHFAAHALRDLAEGLLHPAPDDAAPRAPRTPGTANAIAFHARIAWWRAKARIVWPLRYQQWSVGIIADDPATLYAKAQGGEIVAADVRWFESPRDTFLADPFIAPGRGDEGGPLILAEDYDWAVGRGHISRLTIAGGQVTVTPAITADHHFSYPFLIEEAGALYCVPERARAGHVMLYRHDPASDEWREDGVLIPDMAAADSTIFRHDGRWWMLCTDVADSGNEALHAFYADALRGPWQPHRRNPVKIDVTSARPAGPVFRVGEALVRPAQDCADHYGAAVRFQRIVRLTPDEYREEDAGALIPDPRGPCPAGLHTLSSAGGLTMIDGARWSFQRADFGRLVRGKWKKWCGSGGGT